MRRYGCVHAGIAIQTQKGKTFFFKTRRCGDCGDRLVLRCQRHAQRAAMRRCFDTSAVNVGTPTINCNRHLILYLYVQSGHLL